MSNFTIHDNIGPGQRRHHQDGGAHQGADQPQEGAQAAQGNSQDREGQQCQNQQWECFYIGCYNCWCSGWIPSV